MTDIQEETPAPLAHEIVTGEAQGPTTLAEQLRVRRAEIADTQEVMLPLVGYEEYGVKVKHRLMDRQEVEKLARRVANETKDRGERNMRILLDMIIFSARGFYIHDEDADEDKPILDDRHGEMPVVDWTSMASYLGWTPNGEYDNARLAVYWVFGSNEFMIGQYGIILNRWMNNTGLKIDEEFLGEVL
jgi:hypothetical protein